MVDQEKNESSDYESLVEGNDEDAESLGFRLMHTLDREAGACMQCCMSLVNVASLSI